MSKKWEAVHFATRPPLGTPRRLNMIFQVDDNSVKFLGDDNEVKGAVLFPDAEDGVVDITKTYVAPTERGMGPAGLLMGRAAEHIKAAGKKARLSCSYAQAWFKKHPEYQSLVTE